MLLWTFLLGLWSVATADVGKIKLNSNFQALKQFAQFLKVISSKETYDAVITRSSVFDADLFRSYICKGNSMAFSEYVEHFGGRKECKECQPTDSFHPLLHAYECRQLQMFDYLIDFGFSIDDLIPKSYAADDDSLIPISLKIAREPPTSLRDRFLLSVYDHSKKLFSAYLEPRLKACAVESETGEVVFKNWQQEALTAMANKDFIYIKWLIEQRKAKVNNYFAGYGSFVHAAVQMNCPNCVRVLLLNGADPNEHAYLEGSEKDGWTPLMFAVENGLKMVTQALLEDSRTRTTVGLIKDPFFTARHIARQLRDPKHRRAFLKVLHARPADREILSNWVEAADLELLTVESALKSKNRAHLEFILFNTIKINHNPNWESDIPAWSSIISAEFSLTNSK